jgi:hypothetical protein
VEEKDMLNLLRALSVVAVTAGAASAQPPARLQIPQYQPIAPVALSATLVKEFSAPEARQGVAVDASHFYAVVNNVVAKYEKGNGARVAYWASPRGGLIRHINSCIADAAKLWCANSNFPETPMASSVEVIDSATMMHIESHSMGLMEEGSLTFFERLGAGWVAGFAHYDGEGGLAYKNSAFAGISTFDADWRRTGGWMLPESVRVRMAPHAASGGGIGPDGYLYLLGHDRPEMYVLAKPSMGPVLLHLATIEIDVAGQAFAWDKSAVRTIYAINRPTGSVRVFSIPEIALTNPDARRFR